MVSVRSPATNHASEAAQAAASLRDDGFAVVRHILTREDVDEAEHLLDSLMDGFDTLVERRRGRRRFAHDMALAADKARADQPEILYAASLSPRLAETGLFRKCAAFADTIGGRVSRSFDHVIVKNPWNMSETPWHQDAALTRFRALPRALQMGRLHFWVPLQDATEENGCMEFIAGSHKEPLLRHDRFRRADGDTGLAASPEGDGRRVACPVPVGGFTIHTPRTLHFAGRNATARPRKAWIIHFSRFGRVEIAVKWLFGRAPAPLGIA
jgi:ectoine hydroxylase-related dioxygenase (phytanoyl-CoA dioxygenase family)